MVFRSVLLLCSVLCICIYGLFPCVYVAYDLLKSMLLLLLFSLYQFILVRLWNKHFLLI